MFDVIFLISLRRTSTNEQVMRGNQHTLYPAIQRVPPQADADESPDAFRTVL